MLDNKGFDLWAKEYDKSVELSSNEYPFDGYYNVLNYVYNAISKKGKNDILDIGFGTGVLTNKLYEDGANIFGIDFSQEMINIAQEKMPNGVFIQHDFNNKLPIKLTSEKFNYIISSYAIHHLDNYKKVEFIEELEKLLKPDGKIIIADVSFKTEKDLIDCKNKNMDKWDADEIYMVEENIINSLNQRKIDAIYIQISSCAGVLEIHKK
ncbi:hypothetical protein GCM10008904_26990 [Paraclostridium ghonii]|uniref:AdoMet-dependent methyltransferase n=1 Tax=Paraclostridium ghonii TaxID=29358 RepID=A0ABU0MYS8_9FIRM|nr:class I SAM-dependent methyltransferase [Paeniclostridium ghonii]MDQ0555754.1 putative AdoMet-dependent methyltransferase [Paeniclostridium ghonii]